MGSRGNRLGGVADAQADDLRVRVRGEVRVFNAVDLGEKVPRLKLGHVRVPRNLGRGDDCAGAAAG